MIRKLWPVWGILVALVLVPVLLWGTVVLPQRLLETRGLGLEQRLKAENDLRGTLVTLIAGLAVIAGAIVGAVNLVLTQRVQWRAQVTERFSKAIEQLGQSGPDKLDVRIGAVYALEQIAQDSPKLHWPIMEVLTAYLREHHRWIASAGATEDDKDSSGAAAAQTPADAQAIATVIGRRRHRYDPSNQVLNLQGVDLSGVQWSKAQLARASLSGAQLKGANLYKARLEEADLRSAQLEGAFLQEAQLERASLLRAQLRGAILSQAQLEGANLYNARLEEANLSWAQLKGASLLEARLEGTVLHQAHLEGANLSGAQLKGASLTGAHLEGATIWDAQLEGANFRGAQLKGASLFRSQLRGAHFREPDAESLTWMQLNDAEHVDQAKLPTYLTGEQT